MYRFWETVIEPICENIKAKTIVEVGAQNGFQTTKLIEYARKHSGKVISIDPYPNFTWQEWEKEYAPHFKMFLDLSLNILPKLSDYDIVLLDGDHNWYTVFNELQVITDTCSSKLPIIILHDVCWPYDRRDLYYNPQNIPDEFRNPYEKKALSPRQTALTDKGINGHLFNAIEYGTSRNGVLTAVEDYLTLNPTLSFLRIECMSGLGIIYNPQIYGTLEKIVLNSETLLSLLKAGECARVNEFYLRMCQRTDYQTAIENCNKKVSKLQVALKKEQDQYSMVKNQEQELQTSNRELQISNNELTTTLGKTKDENLVLQAKIHELDVSNKELSLSLKDLNLKVIDYETKIKKLDSALTYEKKASHDKEIADKKIADKEIAKYKSLYKSAIGNVRYHAGTIIVEALQSPKKFFLAPARLVLLAYRHRRKRKEYLQNQRNNQSLNK